MATLTATELARLGNIRPELLAMLQKLMQQAEALGFTTAIPDYGGVRSTDTQAALYADSLKQGGGVLAYPVAQPGRSFHEYGAAFDIHIIAGGSGDDGAGSDDDYSQLADAGEAIGLRAGYHFTNKDPFHFELAETIAAAKAAWLIHGGSSPARNFGALALVAIAAAVLLRMRR